MALYEGMLVIDDSNYRQHIQEPPGQSRGLIPRDFIKIPYGSSPFAPPSTIQKIPRSEWRDRIKERKQRKLRIIDKAKALNVPVCDQGRTNYCWVNAVVWAIMLWRAANGLKNTRLSPASLGAKIKNYQNVGGWGMQAIEGSKKFGIVPTSLWPDNAIDRKYDTAETREAAKPYMATEFFDIRPGDFDMLATYLLMGIPVPAGYNWWGHEICNTDLEEIESGHFGTIIANSWGTSWGTNGYGVLTESKARPDDAQAVIGVKYAG